MVMRKTLLILLSFTLLFVSFVGFGDTQYSFAQTATTTLTPTPTPDVSGLQQQISDLEGKISNLQGQEKTLTSQIEVMDSQIKLTQLRINSTEEQINELTLNIDTATQKVNNIQSSLNNLTQVLMNRVAATYEVGTIQPMQILLTSGTVGDFLERLNYLKIAQAHDKKLLYDTVQAKNDYQNQKDINENEKKQVLALQDQLKSYTDQLGQEKASEQSLLSQTQGDEATYQKQLAAAQAQLASFSSFVTTQGGASLLSNQTSCDSWGCYYNQRDTQWGSLAINGQSGYSMAEYGC